MATSEGSHSLLAGCNRDSQAANGIFERESLVRLLPLEPRHQQKTRDWANDPQAMRLLGRGQTVTEAEHSSWFASLASRTDCRYFAIETAAQHHIGNVWLWDICPRHRKAELRIVVGESDGQGLGLGTAAIQLACELGFHELGLQRVYAYVLAINPRALRSFEKAGFQQEGLLKRDRWTGDAFCDSHLLARLAPEVEEA